MALTPRQSHLRRAERNRIRLRKVAGERLRLSVFRSNKHIAAQIIDDAKGLTLAAASSLEQVDGARADGGHIDGAKTVGARLAERAKAAGVTDVVFDRGGYLFHGRVKALADAAREAGLNF